MCKCSALVNHLVHLGALMTGRDRNAGLAIAPAVGLRPFFSFYGGKWRDAPRLYPRPEHGTIIEPFAGSAGYSVRYPDRRISLSDRDPVIVGVWDYLIRASEREILALPDLAEGQSTADLDVPQEARWLIGFWLNRAAESPRVTPSAWMRSGIRPGSFWGSRVRETIASQQHAIRHWQIQCCDYAWVPTRAATWFIDPPHENAGRHYRYGSDRIDYVALGAWCRSRPGQTIVCESSAATWLPFRSLADTKTTRARMRSHEASWVAENESAL